MAESLSFSDIVESKSTHLSLNVAAGKSIDIVKDNRDVNLIKRTMPSNFDAKEKCFSQCSTIRTRTHDPEQNQDLTRVKSVNFPEHSPSNNGSNFTKKCLHNSYCSEDRTPDDDPTSFGYTPFGMISKKHGVKFYTDQSIPIEQYVLGDSEIVNPEYLIAASRMTFGVVIFVSSLEDDNTICSHVFFCKREIL